MLSQVFWGSVVLIACTFIHLLLVVGWAQYLIKRQPAENRRPSFWSVNLTVGGTIAVLLFSHTIQVWIWAFAIVGLKALPHMSDAVYFSLVTYTTVGYGDVTLTPDFRIFGAMASVTGLFNFGVSTAFLVAVIGRVLIREKR